MTTALSGALASIAVAVALCASAAQAGGDTLAWQERFDHPPLDWSDPAGHDASLLARVYSIGHDGSTSFLHAHHDCSGGENPPAMHLGRAFPTPIPLERIKLLRWRWRATRHPNLSPSDDAWRDAAASVYVAFRQPNVLSAGDRFKFAWLARPGAAGTRQRGFRQVELRHDAATREWKTESVDLCALYRESGACEGHSLLYVGVMTDADGTRSIAEGDYADFEVVTKAM